MSEQKLNDTGVYIEPYANGFMIADYRNGEDARYYGSDLSSRCQPITYSPFTTKETAIEGSSLDLRFSSLFQVR